jgi:hypothetical protein
MVRRNHDREQIIAPGNRFTRIRPGEHHVVIVASELTTFLQAVLGCDHYDQPASEFSRKCEQISRIRNAENENPIGRSRGF